MKTEGRPSSGLGTAPLVWLMLPLALAAACATAPAVAPPSADESFPTLRAIDTLSIRSDTRVLAHDSLAGRGTGTAGARSAARFIAGRLQALGVRPLPTDTASPPPPYLLPVPLLRANVSAATLEIEGGGAHATERTHGDGFVLGRMGREGMRAAAGPVSTPGADSSEATSGTWLLLDGAPGEAALRWLPGWRAAGVIGLIVRLPRVAVLDAYRQQLGDVRWMLAQGPPDPIWQPDLPVLLVGPELGAMLAEPGARVSLEPAARLDSIVDYNVAGYIEGSDPARARELVVLTAHYDHLGIVGGAPGRDSVYNGFSDNAAGVAMLLAVAESAARRPPPRSLLFLFTTAEEVGLLGSLHFVRQREADVARTRAVVNVDAGAPPAPPTRWRLAAGTRSRAGAVAAAVVEAYGWTHRSDPGSPNSDHWPFVQLGIPAVFLIPDGAWEGLDDAEATTLRDRWDRYHHPDDEWAPDFPLAGLARYATLARAIAYALASTEESLL